MDIEVKEYVAVKKIIQVDFPLYYEELVVGDTWSYTIYGVVQQDGRSVTIKTETSKGVLDFEVSTDVTDFSFHGELASHVKNSRPDSMANFEIMLARFQASLLKYLPQ